MTQKQMMKAIGFYRSLPIDHPESLQDVKVEQPAPTGRELRVRVKAISVNPLDVKIRASRETAKNTPHILGWDIAGVVDQTGPDCTFFQPGDHVFYAGTMTRPGGNSEYHLVDERIVGKKPETLDFAEAAALPLTGITAWEALFDRLGIPQNPDKNKSKAILVIGASGGVGSIATQIADLAGLTVIGTASRHESAEWVKKHGATHIINHAKALSPQLEPIGVTQVDYIFCLNNTATYWNTMAELIAPQGKVCSIVRTNVPLDLSRLLSKSATFVWESMFTRSAFQMTDMAEQGALLNKIANLIDEDKLRTTIGKRLTPINAANLRQAHAEIETGRTIGKIVLVGFPD